MKTEEDVPKKVLFIINPISGGKSKKKFIDYLDKINPLGFEIHIAIWEKKNQWQEILAMINSLKYDIIAAVGGDGTVNLIGSALINKKIPMAIIPFGSGNGLARHLKIPLDPFKAIQLIFTGQNVPIDVGILNGKPFFCTSGCGFDAVVAHAFATSGTRGLFGYATQTFKALTKYKSPVFEIELANQTIITSEGFLLTIANANQYGNDVKIAPSASVLDGKLNFTLIKPFPLSKTVNILGQLSSGKIETNSFTTSDLGTNYRITSSTPFPVHIDGEPAGFTKDAKFSIIPHAVEVYIAI
jgi:YegS/Rv2252/BmrU family lipid kinase